MPFEKNEETQEVIWVPPTTAEILEVQKQIVAPPTVIEGKEDVELTAELRNRLSEAVGDIIPKKGWGIIAHSNSKVYETIKAITTSSRGLVDIVIPVYNSIHIAKQCINSVLTRTSWPFHLYVVDDASDEHTKKGLSKLQEENKDRITLLTNKHNRGFAATVNRGIRNGSGEFVCLLNSDVLVTPLWLTKMMMAHKSDERNQIIVPATNNTAMTAIPMSPGASYLQMNRIFESFAVRRYPEVMPTGFCFFFPRNLIDKVGYFDEGYENFGEETDYWMRVLHYVNDNQLVKYRAVMADDTYVFHLRGESFNQLGDETHMMLRRLASGRFGDIWPEFQHWKKTYSVGAALGHLKDPIPAPLINSVGKYHICWVVHSCQMCGGMRYIADIVNEINERGGNARVALIKRKPESDTSCIGELRSAPIIFESYEDFLEKFKERVFKKGVVVAATAELIGVVKTLCVENDRLKSVLHVQSYEPDMVAPTEENKPTINLMKQAFKAVPDVISNSLWISKKLKKELGVKPFATIAPGIDQDLFYPRGRSDDDRPTVMVALIPNSPCKGFDRGIAMIQSLEAMADKENVDIRILVYGVIGLPIKSRAVCLGRLTQSRLANLLGTEVDIFVDPSSLHSYGLPALEAVASGVAVASWDNKGIREYLDANQACIRQNDTPHDEMAGSILSLLKDEEARKRMVERANRCLGRHDRERSVDAFITCLEKRLNLTIVPRRIEVVVPHLRKHGGPTTMLGLANELASHGHNVGITTVYTDLNPEVSGMTDLPINLNTQSIPKCDVLITNSDNEMCEALSKYGKAKKKIMLKLSHNPRFKILEERGLQCNWDAVVTSTNWLKDVCEKPTEEWNYKPVKATRIGWWHYSHEQMRADPITRKYSTGTESDPIIIATLVHQHSSKGTQEAISALGAIFKEYGSNVRFVGIGEVPPNRFSINLPNWQYVFSPNRHQMAEVLGNCDIWVGASHTEGLGRMALEAMSAGMACILSDTGAEFARHGDNCLLYPVGDVSALTDAIKKLLTKPEITRHIREEGFQTAKKMSNPEDCINTLERVIEGLFK